MAAQKQKPPLLQRWRTTWSTAYWASLCVAVLVSCASGQEPAAEFGPTPGLLDQHRAGTEPVDEVGGDGATASPSQSTQGPALPGVTGQGGLPSEMQTPSAADATPHATRVVRKYLQLTDRVGATSGEAVEAMADIVTHEWLAVEQRGFQDYRERQIKTLGQTEFFALGVQSVRWSHNDHWEVAVFACIDARRVWVIPADSPDIPEGLVEWLSGSAPPTQTTATVKIESGESDSQEDEPTDADVSAWQEFIAQTSPDAGPLEPVLLWLVGPELESLKVDATDTWRGYHPCGTDTGSR
ncbi:MAG: hypothetical protein WD400_02920 [Pontimonas sp.]